MNSVRDLPFSLDLLRGFEAAARHLSFTRAARELFLTQSAVSRQIQQLEEQLGVKLFHRRTRALALTEAGERYFRAISIALTQVREATVAVQKSAAPIVRITTPVTFASLWLVPRVGRFQARHADVTVHVAADNVVRDLEREGLDIAVRYTRAELAGADAQMLFGETVAPVCTRAFARKHGRIARPQDLVELPLLHFEDPDVRTPWLSWQVWFEAMQVPNASHTRGLRFSHYDQLLQAATAGQGVALGRFPLAQRLIDEGALVLPLNEKRQAKVMHNRAYWLVVAPSAAQRPEVKTFVRWLREEVAR
jgi:DNA-binding transcriptional LysR family regulator